VLHSLDHSEMFTELYREEKREEGVRGGQKDKGGYQKEIRHWRDQQTEEAKTEGTALEVTGAIG